MIVTPEIFAKLSQQGFAETDLGRQPLLGKLTEDELAIFEIERSLDWCGVGWEERDLHLLALRKSVHPGVCSPLVGCSARTKPNQSTITTGQTYWSYGDFVSS